MDNALHFFTPFPSPRFPVHIPISLSTLHSCPQGAVSIHWSWAKLTPPLEETQMFPASPLLPVPTGSAPRSPAENNPTETSQSSSWGELGPPKGWWWAVLPTHSTNTQLSHACSRKGSAHARNGVSCQQHWKHLTTTYTAIPSTPILVGFTWSFL